MITGPIVADDLGPGTDNPARIAALRQRLINAHPDAFPFLLLPVRLETRFMRVDRPVAVAPPSSLAQIVELRAQLDAIAGRDLATDLSAGKRATVKGVERAHTAFLDGATAAVEAARMPVLASLRSTGGVADDPAALRAAATALGASYAAAQASVARLRSPHQRAAYAAALTALHDQVIAPIQSEVASAAAPKLELVGSLRSIAAGDAGAMIAGVQRTLSALGPRPGPGDVVRTGEALAAQLAALRDGVHGLIRGTRAELDGLHAAWRSLASALAKFTKLAGSLAGRDAARSAALTGAIADLASLAGGSIRNFELLSNLRLDRSARAASEVDARMAALAALLATPVAPVSGRAAQAVAILGQAGALASRTEAVLRDVVIVPRARYAAAVERYRGAAAALAPWRARVADVAARGDLAAQVALRDGDAAFAALERATLSQRTDAWDAYAAPVDVVRRKLFALDTTTVMATVDELWVRIFPDDIAVQTHEPGLTDDELRDGAAFWAETQAAAGDQALQRGAWRALVQRYGSPRAAWIARTLEPTAPPGPVDSLVAPASFAPGMRAVRAVETLRRRIVDRGNRRAVDRPGSTGMRKILAAAAAAVAAAREARELSPAQRRQLADLLSAIRGHVDGLAGRSARFSASRPAFAARDGRGDELATLRDRLGELDRLAQAAAIRDPHRAPARAAAAAVPGPPPPPPVPTRVASWTQAPHCPALPNRFVVLAVRGGHVVHTVAGGPVGDVRVGLDPRPDAPDELFALDDDGNLVVGDSIRWLVDFDEAVAQGMAVRVPITTVEADSGFDELLVLGIREDSAADALALVRGVIDNHHYTTGMAFLPIGSPTNNTEAQLAAHRSDDDPDHSFDRERGAPLFTSSPATPLDAADGLRFARALGLDPATVAHIDQAGGRDAGDARIMNEALWPATIGSYLEEFLGSLVAPDTSRRLRAFFRDNVSARGWVPAFRVGHQPYGVLTTTAFASFVPDGGDALPPLPVIGPAGLSEADRQHRFDILLRDLLAAIADDWSRIRAAKVKHVHSPGVTDPQRHFMDILGLSPVSVGAEYRFALNVGARHPVASGPQLVFGYSDLGPLGLFERFDGFLRRAYGLPAGPLLDHGLVTAPLRAFFELLTDERAYSVRVLDRARSVHGAVSGPTGASYAAGLLARSLAGLVSDARHRVGASHALLFMLLRHALVTQALNSTLNILEIEGILTADARRRSGSSDTFLVRNLAGDAFASKWSYVFDKLADLDGRLGPPFPKGPGTLFSYLTAGARTMADYVANRGTNAVWNGFAGSSRHAAERTQLADHADRVARVGQIAALRIDALVREHLDLCSHRLDAWRLGLAVRRLGNMRAAAPTGVFLGAYGWLENLRPKPDFPLAEGVPPALHRDGEPPVLADPSNEGFIHTPSVSHAVTAAILRSAYLSETSQPDLEDAMAVNLSSRRVRMALELLDGVQAGNDLGALLGYRLERELHEAYATEGVSFDAVIFALRSQYPGVAGVDPATSTPETARRLVVDGLTLINAVRDWVASQVALAARRDRTLFEVLSAAATQTLPLPPGALDAQHRAGVFRALDSLADAVDALGDLALSEAVFQVVRGNFPRAAAVAAALAEGRPVPRPQIARTPRSGTTVVHRVLLPLPRFDGHALSSLEVADAGALAAARGAALPAGWSTPMVMTSRANAEPGLNAWLGQLLGDPAHIVCRFEDPATGAGVHEVSARELGLQPLDLLAMLGAGLEEGAAELAARITYHGLPADLDLAAELAAGPRPQVVVRLDERGAAWTVADRSFAEIEPLLVDVRAMLARARAAVREDAVFDETVAAPAPSAPTWNTGELSARVAEAVARLRKLALDLMAVLAGGPPADDIDAIDAAAWARAHTAVFDDPAVLLRTRELGRLALGAADFGVTMALPPIRFETVDGAAASLRAAVVNAFVQLVGRLHAATTAIAAGDLVEASRALLGKAFVIAPAFALPDAATIRAQLAAPDLLRAGDTFAIDGWLSGVAAVREPIAALRRAWTLGEAFGAAPPTPRPAQLPAQPGDAWLGLPFPAGYQPTGDKLSLVVVRGDAWTADAEVSAILVDQWTETIPNRSETTGIAFHYDSPDAMPPQSLLLVVPPAVRGTWRWDDLVLALHDTLELARSRAVEPEHLAGEIYAQLLPAITGELVPDHLTSEAEVTGSRVILDFGLNNAL